MKRQCVDCFFFKEPNLIPPQTQFLEGECRYNAPRAYSNTFVRLWPLVKLQDWCGKFSSKKPPQ